MLVIVLVLVKIRKVFMPEYFVGQFPVEIQLYEGAVRPDLIPIMVSSGILLTLSLTLTLDFVFKAPQGPDLYS